MKRECIIFILLAYLATPIDKELKIRFRIICLVFYFFLLVKIPSCFISPHREKEFLPFSPYFRLQWTFP